MLKAKIIIKEKKNSFYENSKFFLKKLFNRSRYNYKISTNLKLNTKNNPEIIKKINSKILKSKTILLSSANGLYLLKEGKLFSILKNNGFYGLAKYKNKFFSACSGNNDGHSDGCIISFNYFSGEIKNINIEKKIKEQSLHDMKIWKNNLYLINSTWRYNHLDQILKFNINKGNLILNKKINPDIDFPFIHMNTLFFKKNSILVCYQNMTQHTKIPSQICEFNKDWKFIKILETKNLSSAHDVKIINKKLHVLDSDHGIFYAGEKEFYFKNKFIKGFAYDEKNYYIGTNSFVKKEYRTKMSPELAIINRKKKKVEFFKLPNIGAINNITILK